MPKLKTTIRINQELADKLQTAAKSEGVSISTILTYAIHQRQADRMPDMPEPAGTVLLSVRLDRYAIDKLNVIIEKNNYGKSECLRRLCRFAVRKHGIKHNPEKDITKV